VEESASGREGGAVALTQAVRWLAREESDDLISSTEVRIARLLDDLHDHLAMVEGLRSVSAQLRATWGADLEEAASQQVSPRLCPAPPEVLEEVKTVTLVDDDSSNFPEVSKSALKQTPQCVVCCADFETREKLSQLPGCGHLFHPGCISEWLQRAANCPICRCSLCDAVEFAKMGPQDTPSPSSLGSTSPQQPDAAHPSPSEEVMPLETLPLPVGWSRVAQASGSSDDVVDSVTEAVSGAVQAPQTSPSGTGSRTSLATSPSTSPGGATGSRTGHPSLTSHRTSSQQHTASAAGVARPTSSAVLMGAASSLFTAPDEQRGTGTRQPSRTAATGQSGQRSAGLVPASAPHTRTSVL